MFYFDHNATTPVAPEVGEVFARAIRDFPGNASSVHRQGQMAHQQLERSRRVISDSLGASPSEIVFTSGGTESNNLAILGLLRSLPGIRKHVITTAIEHPCVMEPLAFLADERVEVTRARVDRAGFVDAREIARLIRPETVLISVMHANNETGAIQPLSQLSSLVRERRAGGEEIFLHSDGVQAFGKLNVNVQELGVDLYAVSAHKIYGPKGLGALYVRKGTPVRGIQLGGRHERERRAGTENVPGAIAFARAVQLCNAEPSQQISVLRDSFERRVLAKIEGAAVNGSAEVRLPNTSSLRFDAVSGESLLIALDMKGMAVSTGSACSSGSIEPSHVLLAMGYSREQARSSVRFSFGRYNTMEEVDQLVEAVAESVASLRKSRTRKAQLVS